MTKSEEKYKSLGTEEKIAENVKKIKGLFKDVTITNTSCWKIQQYTPAAARTPAAAWKSTWARML